jgi:HlyD family secretion protein
MMVTPMKIILMIIALIIVAGTGVAYYANHSTAALPTSLRTVAIERGDLLSTIGATGTVEPEEVVDIGAQVMGSVLEFGPDLNHPGKSVDFCSVVAKDALLAKIDPTPYEAALEQAEAQLERSEVDLLQLEARCEQSEQDWKRAKQLQEANRRLQKTDKNLVVISDTDYDLAAANYKVAKANVAVGKATIRQNKASVRVAKTNLGYATIKSPVRGVILDRRVNVGQTVVANLNTPSLFLIAKDLTKMQVWASVNEADIGRIRLDMPVQFTVDAYENQTFHGKVTQIRMNAQMTQNVVTYTVIVTTDNSDGRLLPYLTANVKFEVDKRSQVFLVPNAALRWTPESGQIDPSVDQKTLSEETSTSQERGRLWIVAKNGLVQPLEVRVGATDGTMTEVGGALLKEGMQVVSGEEGDAMNAPEGETADGGDKESNPFMPKLPKGSKPPPGPM